MTEKNTNLIPTNNIESKIETYNEFTEDNLAGRLVFMGFLAIASVAGIVGTDQNKEISTNAKYSSKLYEAIRSFDDVKQSLATETSEPTSVKIERRADVKLVETVEPKKESVKPAKATTSSGSIIISATVLSAISCDAELNCVTNDPDARIYKTEKDGVVTIISDY